VGREVFFQSNLNIVGKLSIYSHVNIESDLYLSGRLLINQPEYDDGFDLNVNGNIRAQSYYQYSDERLKTNIDVSSEKTDFEKIMKVNVKTFKYKNDLSKKLNTGVLAQELQSIFPELITKGKQSLTPSDGTVNVLGSCKIKVYEKLEVGQRAVFRSSTSTISCELLYEEKGLVYTLDTDLEEGISYELVSYIVTDLMSVDYIQLLSRTISAFQYLVKNIYSSSDLSLE
tara:strand:+ start:402 stop:1088 length:687 start_codon:yes stop_codon:yes gene_type:complete